MVLGPDIGSAMSWLTTVMLQNGGGIVGGGEGLGVTRGGEVWFASFFLLLLFCSHPHLVSTFLEVDNSFFGSKRLHVLRQ